MSQTVSHAADVPAVPYFVNDFGLEALLSVTVSGTADLAEGTVLGKVTASGKYVAYTDAATNGAGSDTAVGILYHKVSPRTGADVLGSMQVFGVVREASLVGITAAAKADLAGRFFFV